MTTSILTQRLAGWPKDVGALARALLDISVPIGSALLGAAVTSVVQPRAVENTLYWLGRFTQLVFG